MLRMITTISGEGGVSRFISSPLLSGSGRLDLVHGDEVTLG